MEKFFYSVLVSVVVTLVAISNVNAQVTIGSLNAPKATLDVVGSSDGATADGVIAPRLTLAQLKLADSKYLTDQNGAIVYVTNVAGGTDSKTVNITAPGYYYFDGLALVWKKMGGGNTDDWFYMPSIIFDTSNPSTSITLYKNLYEEYKKQLNNPAVKSSNPATPVLQNASVPAVTEFDYFITAYDANVFEILSINPTTSELAYKVIAAASDSTYINIVFKRKSP